MGTSGSTQLAIGYRVLEGAGPMGRVQGHGLGLTRPIRQPINSISTVSTESVSRKLLTVITHLNNVSTVSIKLVT